jgi:hypothetical protein
VLKVSEMVANVMDVVSPVANSVLSTQNTRDIPFSAITDSTSVFPTKSVFISSVHSSTIDCLSVRHQKCLQLKIHV